jgi:acyl-coenzyme A synthetase/AMP-(fatty) acid ligase
MYDRWISFWAKRRPDHIAVVVPAGSVRYGEFDQLINKAARRLQDLGLPEGSRVAVKVADEFAHWVLTLALDRLGFASASLGGIPADRVMLAALKPQLILSGGGEAATADHRILQISQQWFEETRRLPVCGRPERREQPDEVTRYFSSSGSTGTPKVMAVTRAQQSARIDYAARGHGFGETSCGCLFIGLGTGVGYTWPLAFWSTGGHVLLNAKAAGPLGQTLRDTGVSHLFTTVGALYALVRDLPADKPLLPALQVFVVGSSLPRALAEDIGRRLSSNIQVKYGATEVSGIAMGSPALLGQYEETAGYVQPEAEVQVVDESGGAVPPGATGIVRVRTPGMVSAYLDNAPPTAASTDTSLRDGWFYPGDLGSLSADGLLVLRGRANEVMNIAGNKFAPEEFESVALTCAGIREAAAFSVPDRAGMETPWIAVVRGDGYKAGELLERLRVRWPLLGNLRIAVANEIPRNHMGKVDRIRLREQARAWTPTTAR